MKNNKSPGPDGIPAEVLKHGGFLLKNRIYQLILAIWREEEIPEDLKDANIVATYKRKGDRAICCNS